MFVTEAQRTLFSQCLTSNLEQRVVVNPDSRLIAASVRPPPPPSSQPSPIHGRPGVGVQCMTAVPATTVRMFPSVSQTIGTRIDGGGARCVWRVTPPAVDVWLRSQQN